MEKIKELDTVVLLHTMSKHGLKSGDIGTLVHRYSNGGLLEVEFVTGEGKTVAVITLKNEEVRLMQNDEILHACPIANEKLG